MSQECKKNKGYTFFVTLVGLWGSFFFTTPQIGLGTALGETSTGLDFPGSAAVSTTMRFKFTKPQNNGLPIYGPGGNGLTYIWRAYPRQQSGYYTAFFWGNDDGRGDLSTFLWTSNGGADSYYGAHPYPLNPPNGNTHNWEISVEQADYTNGAVEYNRWHTQALRVWADANGNKHHEFYWDLPNTDSRHVVNRTSPPDWGNVNPPAPALTWGDAPWAPGNEVWNGILRGIQVYSGLLTTSEMLSEANAPLSTTAGANTIWYLNMNPTPSDISDKSGKGHHPLWVGSMRPALYSDTSSPDTTPPTISNIVSSSLETTATITWTTNEPADSQIDYGLNSTLGTFSVLDTTLTTNHSVTLTGLQDGTTYFYRVRSRDGSNNLTVSAEQTVATQVSGTIPPTGSMPPLAHWTFDEGTGVTAFDSSANGYNGTVDGAAWTTSGKLNGGLKFDGNNDFVDVGTWDVSGSAITLAMWFKAEDFGNSDARLLTKSTNTAEQDHYFMLSTTQSGGMKLRFRLKTDGTTHTLVANSGTLSVGEWIHAVAVYDGSQMRLYKDGVEVGSRSKTGALSTDNTVKIRIGQNPNGYGSFDGLMDDVRVYNRALTSAEIQQLAAGVPDTTPPIISSLASSSTEMTATITWTTDEAADSQIDYGLNSTLGTFSVLDATLTTNHVVTLAGLQAGTTYFYRVRSRDASGNLTVSAEQTVATSDTTPPDTTPPTVTLTAPSAGTVSGTVTVSASASDNVGVTGVQFRLQGANLGLEDTTNPYSTSWNTTTVPNGSYTLTAIARDAAGNTKTAAAVTVTVNNTSPPPPSGSSLFVNFQPSSSSVPSGYQKDDGSVYTSSRGYGWTTFVNTRERDAHADQRLDTFIHFDSGTSVTWKYDLPNGDYLVSLASGDPSYDQGPHHITIEGITVINNQTTASNQFITITNHPITVSDGQLSLQLTRTSSTHTILNYVMITPASPDTTPPTVTLTAPNAGTVSGTVTVSASANDNVGVTGVQFRLEGANLGPEDTTNPYSTSWNTTTASNGSYTLTAIARDAAGNTKTAAAVPVIVSNTSTPPPPGGGTPVIAWTAADQNPSGSWRNSTWANRSFRVLLDGSAITTNGTTVQLTLRGRPSGNYTVQRASLVQREGNTLNGVDGTNRQVTFGGTWEAGVTVPAGETVTSDPIPFDLIAGQDVFLTYWVSSGNPTVYRSGGANTSAWTINGTDQSSTIDWESLAITATRSYLYIAESLEVIN